jgi:hypothetical protein
MTAFSKVEDEPLRASISFSNPKASLAIFVYAGLSLTHPASFLR